MYFPEHWALLRNTEVGLGLSWMRRFVTLSKESVLCATYRPPRNSSSNLCIIFVRQYSISHAFNAQSVLHPSTRYWTNTMTEKLGSRLSSTGTRWRVRWSWRNSHKDRKKSFGGHEKAVEEKGFRYAGIAAIIRKIIRWCKWAKSFLFVLIGVVVFLFSFLLTLMYLMSWLNVDIPSRRRCL